MEAPCPQVIYVDLCSYDDLNLNGSNRLLVMKLSMPIFPISTPWKHRLKITFVNIASMRSFIFHLLPHSYWVFTCKSVIKVEVWESFWHGISPDWHRCLNIVKAVSQNVFAAGQLWWRSHTLRPFCYTPWQHLRKASQAMWVFGGWCMYARGFVYLCTCNPTRKVFIGPCILLPHLQITHP